VAKHPENGDRAPSDETSGRSAESQPVAAKARKKVRRLLWEVRTGGGKDCFLELTPGKGKLLAMRRGVLHAFDADTGRLTWRFPEHGTAARFDDPQYGSYPPFVLGVLGNEVITCLPRAPGEDELGVLAIRLEDGAVTRELRLDITLPSRRSPWKGLLGSQLVFWATDEQGVKTQVSVADLAEWREIARFELPMLMNEPRAYEGRVYGFLARPPRAFTVDLGRGEIYSLPMRSEGTYDPSFHILPDGAFVTRDGRVSEKCAYQGPWAVGGYVVGDAVYGSHPRGFYRCDPGHGRVLWRHPLVRMCSSWRKVAGTSNVVALAEHGQVHVLNAQTGKLRAAVKVCEAVKRDDDLDGRTFLACDDERVYFAGPTRLRAYSTRPADPERPDAADPGDPACYVARCREALAKGEFERALKEVSGIGAAIRIRPSMRAEVAELLSQLDRSAAAALYPELWHDVMLHDGWVAGQLFLDEYTRLGAAASLLAVGTRPALLAASEIIDCKDAEWYSVYLAAEATEMLTGRRPLERHFVHARRHAEVALWRPMDDETFERLLPELTKWRALLCDRSALGKLTPEQVLRLFGNEGPLGRAAKLQAESRARGEGAKQAIVVTRPTVAPAPEAKDEF
jgi:outer membrane protein assembly factor BamB